nr:reverse transcriptase domain-containing protein [Tanacetum cinerariifolium]
MACSILHTDSEVEALVQKLIDEDKGRQNAILDSALQFKNSCRVKNDLKNVYEKCTDISQESRALIDSFLKEGSDKDYELNLSMDENAAKLEKQMDAKLAWLSQNTTTAHKKVAVMSTQEYMQKVVEDVDEDDDFNIGAKLEEVVAIVKLCSSNMLGDLNVTLKDLSGAARIWLKKEPPRLIFTWDDLVLKFINQFFPPSKTTNLRNEITNFQQRFDESFSEAWDRFMDLLRACPHHGFS